MTVSIKMTFSDDPILKPNFYRHKIIQTYDQKPENIRLATVFDFQNESYKWVSGIPFLFQYFFQDDLNIYYGAFSNATILSIPDDSIHEAIAEKRVWVLDKSNL